MRKVAVVGGGVGVRMHLPLLEERGHCQVSRLRLPHGKRSGEGLDSDYDLAILASPPFAQVEQLEILAKQARVILCEKPAGLGSSELESLLQRNPTLGPRVSVNYQLRFDPMLDLCRRLLSAPWEQMQIVYRSAARMDRGTPPWYRDRAQGGGVHFAVLSHLIDLVHFLAGELNPDPIPPPAFGLDAAELKGALADGRKIGIEVDTLAAEACFSLGTTGPGGESWLDLMTGETGSRPVFHSPVDERGIRALSSRAERPWRASQRCLYDTLFGEEEARQQLASLADAIRVHRVLESAANPYRSNRPSHSASTVPSSPGATT